MDQSKAQNAQTPEAWDTRYEYKIISLMFVGYGLVSLDRFILFPLFPTIAADLGLDYGELGLISAILALTWGMSSFVAGNLADRIGSKTVMVTSAIIFSAMVAFTGLAGGFISLMIIRALMGAAEGAFIPPSISETIKNSKPSRIGLNFGIVQTSQPLFGRALAPVLAIGLLSILPGWQWVFGVVAIPGFIFVYFLVTVFKPERTPSMAGGGAAAPQLQKPSIGEVFKYRNVLAGAIALTALLTTLFVQTTFAPSFLIDYIKVSQTVMSFLIASIGVGGFVGMLLFPAMSDKFGRKPVICGAMTFQFFGIPYLMSANTESSVFLLALAFFCNALSISGTVATLIGPLINTSVPKRIATSATGTVVGIAEILGGAGGPAFAGFASNAYGIEIMPTLMLGSAIVAILVIVFGVEEPKPLDVEAPAQPPS
ncbi:MAG: MFS transporter [Pseudomonadota bacterium]